MKKSLDIQFYETYSYMYKLISEGRISRLEDIKNGDRMIIISSLFDELDDVEYSEVITDYLLPKNLIENLLDLDETRIKETRDLAINHFWNNSQSILYQIFEAADDRYCKEADFAFHEEHKIADDNERYKDMMQYDNLISRA